jgi:hypothetical protein
MGDYFRRPQFGIAVWSLALVLGMVQSSVHRNRTAVRIGEERTVGVTPADVTPEVRKLSRLPMYTSVSLVIADVFVLRVIAEVFSVTHANKF